MAKGKLIVIDGTDGSGKATQTQLLIERMRREGYSTETMAFPRYGEKSAGPVELYLREKKYGPPGKLDPKIGSIFYAVDRFDAAPQIREWLDAGTHVVLDRYVSANMGHQGSKMADPAERREFFAWNEELEYDIFGIPRPDDTIILHVPANVSIRLIEERGEEKDGLESDPEHIRAAERTYLELAESRPDYRLIECVCGGELMSTEETHELVWQAVLPILKG